MHIIPKSQGQKEIEYSKPEKKDTERDKLLIIYSKHKM